MNTTLSSIATHLKLTASSGIRDGYVTAATYTNDPVQEYESVRSRIGLSDLSYYGKVRVSGNDALDLINHVILTDLARLPINQAQTTLLINDDGAPCGEAFVINYGDHYVILSEGIAPASLAEKLSALADSQFKGAVVSNQTDSLGLIGLDGPYSWELLKSFMGIGVIGLRYLEVSPDQTLNNISFTICRAGKTGEYGYFLLCAVDQVAALWDGLMELGKRFDMRPIGYQTIDLCKLENRFSNIQQEGRFVEDVLALNTRVMVSRDKGDYAGRSKIEQLMEDGSPSRIIGVSFSENEPAENPAIHVGAEVSSDGELIGKLCSAGYSPTLKRWIGLVLVQSAYAYVGLDFHIAGKVAKTVSAPFIFNKSLQIRPQEDSYFN